MIATNPALRGSTTSRLNKSVCIKALTSYAPQVGKVLLFFHSSFLRAAKELGWVQPAASPPEVLNNFKEQKGLSNFTLLLVFLETHPSS